MQQQLHVDASGSSSSAGSAWDEHADAALLSEMAALLSPLANSSTSTSFSFATSAPLPQQVPHAATPSAAAVVVHDDRCDLDAAMVDVDEDLDMLHAMLNTHAQSPALLTDFQLASVLAPLVPPPAPLIQPPTCSSSTLASKTPRERQKTELDDLRVQVAELETELEKRKQQRELVVQQTRSADRHSTIDSAATSWWASAAQRQVHEKARVAADNAMLRDLVFGQLRLAKSLEKVLEKRRMCESTVLHASLLASLPSDVASDDTAVFAQLAQALESRTLTADAVFQAHGLDVMTTDAIDAGIARDDTDDPDAAATVLTIKVVKLHPFDARAVDDACWRALQSSPRAPTEAKDTNSVVADASDNAVAIRCVLALQSNLPLLVRSVIRRIHEAERVVYMWETAVESLASPSNSNSRHSSIRIVASGWGSVESIALPNTSVACITRHFARATPTFEARGDAVARQVSSSSGALTDLLIASYLQRVETLHESIQDALLARQLARG